MGYLNSLSKENLCLPFFYEQFWSILSMSWVYWHCRSDQDSISQWYLHFIVSIRNFITNFSFQLYCCVLNILVFILAASSFPLVELIWLQNSIIMYVRFWWKILSYQNRLSYIFCEHNFILWVQILKCLFIKGHFHLVSNFWQFLS